jgi:hypothetical protein
MTFSVFMTISFDNANLVRSLLFAKALPNLGVRAANAISDACLFVASMFVQIVTLDIWQLESRSFDPERCLARTLEIRDFSTRYTALVEYQFGSPG